MKVHMDMALKPTEHGIAHIIGVMETYCIPS